MANWRIGVDSGGTFTDVCLFDEDTGGLNVWKVPSTPQDPSQAIAGGVEQGLEAFGGGDVRYFGHGTTVATNALIMGRTASTGLITTDGFRDLLEIARQKRPSLYDLQCDKPVPLVRRSLRLEVPERLRHDGRVETPLDEEAVRRAARTLKQAGVEAVAIAFLYSFVDPDHERRARAIVEEVFPEAFVSASHEIAPEFREYERLSTVTVNASLGPVMSLYIRRLQQRVEGLGIESPPHITQSNGGIITFETAALAPVKTVLSGPATGVVGAIEIGRLSGFNDLITFDMGGTSTDVALIDRGRPKLSGEMVVHGHPLKTPMLDINTVGAGGGSIAYIDTGGLLKVGPRSAGADPGPVCYGRGNDEPAVTDANVALGVLNPTHLLGGRMEIDRGLAVDAIAKLGDRLGLGAMETAQGIISIVTANMAKAIRVISVQRGYDPRDFTLMAFGGAGPIHASRLARELELPRIIVPPHPGILCAIGLLLTDLQTNYARTRLAPLEASSLPLIEEIFADLSAQAHEWLEHEGMAEDARKLRLSVDMRYAGQNYELDVPFPQGPVSEETLDILKQGFEAAHERLYGYIAPEEPVQLVTFRIEATGIVEKAQIRRHERTATPLLDARIGQRGVWMPETRGEVECPLYDRTKLGPGHVIDGPAIVEQMDSTTLLLPGQRAVVDPYLNLVIEEVPA
ncbi:MAG: hydantoinase/oxoprolinase family protein [Geminicoccaceae bacterium]|nr:hydantoinase/oxoprolinase family protein [Geminicoccaceae bacterium]MCB9945743.1 hydantoinase/oxoprolinase family protein [Geminicoccaceae bacterium]